MDQNEQESSEQTWKWEIIEDPKERLRLLDNTIEERVIQDLAYIAGFLELSTTDNPNAKTYAKESQDMFNVLAQRLRTLQRVIRSDPKQPIPVDRATYSSSGKAIIILDQIPKL